MVNFLWENIFRRPSQQEAIRRTLRANFIFQTLSNRELKFVEDIVHLRMYHPGEPVFQQDEVGVGMYIILSGTIDVTIREPRPENNYENDLTFVTRLSAGDFFGEISLAEENSRRTANAIAVEDTTVIGFFKPDLMEILERNPSTGSKLVYRLSEVLGRRLRETTNKVSSLRKELKLLRTALEEIHDGTPAS